MRLRDGQLAPPFDMVDISGHRVALYDYLGSRILISFYRAAVCPLCTLRAWHLMSRYDAYRRAGMACIAFFESSPEQTHVYLDHLRSPFPIIADLDRRVYDLYGMESSFWGAVRVRLFRASQFREAATHEIGGNMVQNLVQTHGPFGRMPADFLIGPDLRIERAYYGRDAGDFLLFSEIDQFARLS